MIERARKQGRASEVKITRVMQGTPTFNEETGEFESTTTTQVHTSIGVKIGYEQSDIDGTLIKQGDQQLYVPALGFTRPTSNEQIQVGSTTYTAVSVEVLAPGDTDILYIVQLRGV